MGTEEALPWETPAPHLCLTHLEDVVSTLAAEVVLTRQDDHRLGEHLQTDGTDELLLQTLHEEHASDPDRHRKEEEEVGAGRRAGNSPSVFRQGRQLLP